MKKIIYTLCGVALMMGATACDSCNHDKYSAEDVALGDSIAVALGHVAGADEYNRYERMKEYLGEDKMADYNRNEYMRGLELALNTDSTNVAFIQGLMTGAKLYQSVYGTTNELGFPVNPKLVANSFRELYTADSLPNAMVYMIEYRKVVERVQAIVEQRQLEAAEAAAAAAQEPDEVAVEEVAVEEVAEAPEADAATETTETVNQ